MWTPLTESDLTYTLTQSSGIPLVTTPVAEDDPNLFWDGSMLRAVDFVNAYWTLTLNQPARVRVSISGFEAQEFDAEDPAKLIAFPAFTDGDPVQDVDGILPLMAKSAESLTLRFYSGFNGENVLSSDFLIEVCPESNKRPWWYCIPETKIVCPTRSTGPVEFEAYDTNFKFPLASSRVRRPLGEDCCAEEADMIPPPDELNPPPPIIVDGSVGNSIIGTPISYVVYTATGGNDGPYEFFLHSGTFPTGMTLNPDGSVTGESVESGMFEFEIIAVDSSGHSSEPYYDNSRVYPAWASLAREPAFLDNPNGNCITHNNAGLILLVTSVGSTYTTTDGVNWTLNAGDIVPGAQSVLNNVRWVGDRFIVAGDTNNLPSSVDGVTWVPSNAISITMYDPVKRDVAWNGVRYVVVGNFRTWVSTDALTYTRDDDSPLPAEDAWSIVLAVGSLFVAFTFNSAVGATSTNGLDWVQHSLPAGADYWRDAKYANGIYMAVSANGKGAVSVDGVNWSPIQLPTGKSYRALAYGHGEWLAVGTFGAASSKDNGQTWTVESVLPDGANGVVPHPDPAKRFLISLSSGGVAYWRT